MILVMNYNAIFGLKLMHFTGSWRISMLLSLHWKGFNKYNWQTGWIRPIISREHACGWIKIKINNY